MRHASFLLGGMGGGWVWLLSPLFAVGCLVDFNRSLIFQEDKRRLRLGGSTSLQVPRTPRPQPSEVEEGFVTL